MLEIFCNRTEKYSSRKKIFECKHKKKWEEDTLLHDLAYFKDDFSCFSPFFYCLHCEIVNK